MRSVINALAASAPQREDTPNLPPADRAAALDALLRLAQFAVDFPDVAEVEINPLRVQREGQGAVALDVRMRVARDG